MIDLIFCAGNNKKFADIAINTGFKYGAQLPCGVYGNLYFADQNWKNPNRERYIEALRQYEPTMASVIDWEYQDQLPEVIGWAHDVAEIVDIVIIIPKVPGGIPYIPRSIRGKSVRLGYSVPTKYGGTLLHVAEFCNRPVHLLGGSPGSQMKLSQYMNVLSADGNMHMKMANRGLFWERGKTAFTNSWVSLADRDGTRWIGDGNYEAFRRSCLNIQSAWINLLGVPA